MALQDINEAFPFLGCYVQRFSTTFGINNSPSSLELTLVPGDPNSSHDVNGTSTNGVTVTGFDLDLAQPGNMSGLNINVFNFAGIIQSYEETLDAGGHTYSVRLVDPRIIFDGVQVVLDPKYSFDSDFIDVSGLKNYLDIYHYYDNESDAEANDKGVPWNKVRNFLGTSAYGVINCYGSNFRLLFDESFQDFGNSNLDGIPRWYRIDSSRISLSELINKVASDHNKDWYAYVEYTGYVNSNGTGIMDLVVKGIERSDASGSTSLNNIIDVFQNDGVNTAYKRGAELRDDPNAVVLNGPESIQWVVPNSGEQERFWGFYPDYGVALTTSIDSSSGIVLLDHIEGLIATGITSTVTIEGTSYIKNPNLGDPFPPSIVPSSFSEQVKGYYPTNNTLDAAAYSREAWEAVLFREQQDFAESIGISRSRIKTFSDYQSALSSLGQGFSSALGSSITNTGSGIDNRDNVQEALISAVYDATKEVVNNYYGKSWLVNITPTIRTNPATISSTGFLGSQLYPKLDFETVDAGWIDPSSDYPYSIGQHEILYDTNNPLLKLNDGRVRAFVTLHTNTDIPIIIDALPGRINTSVFDKNNYMMVDSGRIAMGINVQTYDLEPDKAVVTLPYPIETYPINVSGFELQKAFYEFLVYFDYPTDYILNSGLISKAEDNSVYGFMPPRAQYIIANESASGGLQIPVIDKYDVYGPYLKVSTNGGKVNVIEDNTLAPWTFAGIDRMNLAGRQIIDSSISQAQIVESAFFKNAGLPEYRLGDEITSSANITAIAFQLGQQGFETSYTIRTFAQPPFKTTKLLQDKVSESLLLGKVNEKKVLDLDKIDPGKRPQFFRPNVGGSQNTNTGSTNSSSSKGNPSNNKSTNANSYVVSKTPPRPNGAS